MAVQKRRIKDNKTTRFNRFKRFCTLVGILATTTFGGCSSNKPDLSKGKPAISSKEKKKQLRFRCYDYKDKKLRVYIEDKSKQSRGKETGREEQIDFSSLGIKDKEKNLKPLAYFCNHNGYLFWVSTDTVYIKKIKVEKEKLIVSKVLEVNHLEPDEFVVPGVKVVSADIWKNPDANWEKIVVATLSQTGLFQASRYSLKSQINEEPERRIINLMYDNELENEDRWKDEGIAGATVSVLNDREFSAIPIGVKGKGNVQNIYYIVFTGKPGESLRLDKWDAEAIMLTDGNPNLINIFKITKPVRYEKSKGGWCVNLLGELGMKKNGKLIRLKKKEKLIRLFPSLTPKKE